MSRRLAMASMAVLTLLALSGCAGAYVAGDAGPHHQDNLIGAAAPARAGVS